MLTDDQFAQAAAILNCDVSAVKAVSQVESSGNGFLANGKPKILFEGQIFWQQLTAIGMDPTTLQAGNEDILYPQWIKAQVMPLYAMDQYQRLAQAQAINSDATLKSASWGAFQIMGFNYFACGYTNVNDFVTPQNDEYQQLVCFCNFLKSNGLDTKLQNQDWAGFAEGYNGPAYAQNQYDVKLENAFNEFENAA